MTNSITIREKIRSFDKKIKVSGDKSISIRWVLFSSVANGTSVARNLLQSEDVLAAINAIKKLGIKALWLSIGFFLAVIINSSLILETLNSLQLSPSKLSINNPLTNIKQMEYAMLPLGYFIPDIILKEVYDIIKLNFWPINSLIDIGEGFWGFPVLILSIVGF